MTEVVKLTTTNNNVNLQTSTRIFSLRGCHLIAMFARTAIAKEFRKWVLDVLDKEIGEPVQIRLTSDDTLPLRNAVNIATGVLKLDYSTIYKMVHQRFGINEIKDLSKDEVGQAVEYIHSLMLQCGKKSDNDIITHNAHNLVWHTMYIYKWYRGVEEAFYKLSPQISSCVHDHIMEAKGNANRLYQLMNFDFNKDCPRRLG